MMAVGLAVSLSLVWKLMRDPLTMDVVQDLGQGLLDNVDIAAEGNNSSDSPGVRETRTFQIPLKRTFSGEDKEIWSEYIRYFDNVASLNNWRPDRALKVFCTVLRGQAEVLAYGLPETTRANWDQLRNRMDERFGHKAMKESYIAEAKLRKRKTDESFRDFAQALQDLFRRAYPTNREYVEESTMKTFLDNCSQSENQESSETQRYRNSSDYVRKLVQQLDHSFRTAQETGSTNYSPVQPGTAR
ncbi:hypothetical protein KP79_PYT26053 [Mizuhopecten yessoensis]|uniref:Retrotransposon gag domain-containing protein n=1 Tax=Mizuhopecten yessoensis TaxID=6573 RepID=A0A210PHY8_MIZYE|nr:hypothetical protein KP79_PYT26053 [Mizuhopecten yessoensis]